MISRLLIWLRKYIRMLDRTSMLAVQHRDRDCAGNHCLDVCCLILIVGAYEYVNLRVSDQRRHSSSVSISTIVHFIVQYECLSAPSSK